MLYFLSFFVLGWGELEKIAVKRGAPGWNAFEADSSLWRCCWILCPSSRLWVLLSALLGFPVSPMQGFLFTWVVISQGKSVGWFSCVVHCIAKWRHSLFWPHEPRQPTKHIWQLAKEVIPALGKKHSGWACSSSSSCWADSYSGIDIESQENCSLPSPAKNIQIQIYNDRSW